MGEGVFDGSIELSTSNGERRMFFHANSANISVGGQGESGDVFILSETSKLPTNPIEATVALKGNVGSLGLGSNGANGQLRLFQSTVPNLSDSNKKLATVQLDANGNLWLGGNKADGDLILFRHDAPDPRDPTKATVHLDGSHANVWLGGNGANGDVMLFSAAAPNPRDHETASIWLSSKNGDIVLQNGDCAEDFDLVEELEDPEPGTVLVVTESGKLAPSETPYDQRVCGVVAGAGDARPGIILGRRATTAHRTPVALLGRVFCKADAQEGPIQIGSLLTTGTTKGHAMRAHDRDLSFGAVLGKALAPLDRGQRLIPVLVALQ